MTEKKPLNINIQSEIGGLDAVLLHTPGAEVENMTPKMAQRALYRTGGIRSAQRSAPQACQSIHSQRLVG